MPALLLALLAASASAGELSTFEQNLGKDSPAPASSGSGGKTSSPITSQTTYTLACTGFPGATPISVIETVTVNIIPVFEEK